MKISKAFLPAVAIAALFAGCQDENLGYTVQDVKNSKYDQEFAKVFGNADPNQDWSMAAEIKASVNLPNIKGTAKMNIMTGDPRNSSTRLLHQVMIQDGQAEFNFDALKGSSSVFVTVEQEGKYRIFGNYAITNGQLMIGQVEQTSNEEPITRAFSETCPTTQSTTGNYLVDARYAMYPVFDRKEYKFGDDQHTWEDWEALVPTKVNGSNSTDNQYLPFTDESVRHFIKGTRIDWETSDLELKEGATANDVEMIYDANFNTKWTIAAAKAKAEEEAAKIAEGFEWTGNPYKTSSLKTKVVDDVIVIDWENSTPELKDGYTLYEAGEVITYNNRTTSVAIFKSEAEAAMYNILSVQYNIPNITYAGPWDANSIEVITEDAVAGATGAVYVGLYPVNHWVRKEVEEVTVNKPEHVKIQYLTNVEKEPAPVFNCMTGSSFFGPGSFFEEKKAYNSETKLGVYYDEAEMYNMEKGFAIKTTASTSTIELPYIFGCTAYSNQFGYVYWKTGDEKKPGFNPLALKHFILMEDARPKSNIYVGTTWGTEDATPVTGENMPTYMNNFVNASKWLDGSSWAQQGYEKANVSFTGTKYRVMYFGDDYSNETGSYNWGSGYTIVFFISCFKQQEDDDEDLFTNHNPHGTNLSFNYSLSSMNKLLVDERTLEPNHPYQFASLYKDKTDLGMVKSITYSRNGVTYMGFGDNCGDQDLNDIVFMVNGTFDTEVPLKKFAPVRWHYNYEGTSTSTTNDIFDEYSLSLHMGYNEPKKAGSTDDAIPAREGYVFKGWASSATATSGSTDISSTVDVESGDDWYAIWEIDIPVTPDPEEWKWLFACEDLGGTYDYDFNDLVFWVAKKKIENSENAQVVLTPLASGGTLKVNIVYNDEDKGEFHKLLMNGAEDTPFDTQLNCYKDNVITPANEVVIGTCAANTSINDIKKLLKVRVVKGENEATDAWYITAPQKGEGISACPQVLILPEDWSWPSEGTLISSIYPGFSSWAEDAAVTSWCNTKADGATEFVQNPSTGGGGSGGSSATPRTNEVVTFSNNSVVLDYNTYFKGLTTVTLKVTKGSGQYQFNYGYSDEWGNMASSLSATPYAWYDEDQTFSFNVSALSGKNFMALHWGNWNDATLTITVQ